MRELAQSAYANRSYRVYLVGGGTAVLEGWRESSIDADLYAPQERILRDVQAIKERLPRCGRPWTISCRALN
jgi:hypothetical protein